MPMPMPLPVPRYPFSKIEKIALIILKNDLIVLIHRLNVHLCSNLKSVYYIWCKQRSYPNIVRKMSKFT